MSGELSAALVGREGDPTATISLSDGMWMVSLPQKGQVQCGAVARTDFGPTAFGKSRALCFWSTGLNGATVLSEGSLVGLLFTPQICFQNPTHGAFVLPEDIF
jgi:hypothetical protein